MKRVSSRAIATVGHPFVIRSRDLNKLAKTSGMGRTTFFSYKKTLVCKELAKKLQESNNLSVMYKKILDSSRYLINSEIQTKHNKRVPALWNKNTPMAFPFPEKEYNATS